MHTEGAIDDGWEYDIWCGWRAFTRCSQCSGDFGIDSREAFEITLGMTGGEARDPCSFGAQLRAATRQHLLRAMGGGEPEAIRFLLRPFESTLFAIDTQAQGVLVAVSHLTGPQHATGAIWKSQ